MHRHLLLAILLPSLAASAGTRMAVLAVGDCRDGDLLNLTRDLSGILASRSSDELVRDESVRQRVGNVEASTPEELRVRLNVAQTSFYNGALNKADEQLAALLEQIARLPPGPDRVALTADAHVLRAMALRNLDRAAQGDDELRAVLRMDPDFSLDADNYAPQLRARVDKLRRDLARDPRAQLRVGSDPSGATVFVDGKALGKTPLQLDLPPATYSVTLKLNGRWSFPRTLALTREAPTSLRVDAGFETLVDTHGPTCLEEPRQPEARLGAAVKLATLLEAGELVLVRLEQPATGARWLTASLVNAQSAQRIREGGIKLEREPRAQTSALEELAHFIVTGNLGRQVQPVIVVPPLATPAAPAIVVEPSGPPSPRAWMKPTAITAAALAGGALAAGIVLTFRSASHWSQFNQYYATPGQAPTPAQLSSVATLKGQAETERTWAYVAYGGAAAFAAASITLFVLEARAPAAAPAPALSVRPVISPWALGLAGAF